MGTVQALTTTIDARHGVASVALSGELDMATVPVLNHQLGAVEQGGAKTIVLDLRELTFVDSSGLHALVGAYNRSELNGHRILLVGASRSLRRLCEMTGTEFLLTTRDGSRLGV